MKEITNMIVKDICPIIDTLSTVVIAIAGVIGVTRSLPKISKQMSEISQKANKKRFNICEIKKYEFDQNAKSFGSEEHKECLLRKLTMSINLVGGVNGIFNGVKDHLETQKRK
jgi:hypothetical protein